MGEPSENREERRPRSAGRELRQRRGSFNNGIWEFIHTLRLVVKDQGYTERYDNSQRRASDCEFRGAIGPCPSSKPDATTATLRVG